eukprot:7522511-Alexandrium_andersonii.AAC.1
MEARRRLRHGHGSAPPSLLTAIAVDAQRRGLPDSEAAAERWPMLEAAYRAELRAERAREAKLKVSRWRAKVS